MSKGDQRQGHKGDQDNQEEAKAQKEQQHLFEDAALVEGVLRLIETVERSNKLHR